MIDDVSERRTRAIEVFLFYVFAFALFAYKFAGTHVDDVAIFLWAEDGNVFLNDANRNGFNSIFHAYAGYIHIYSRVIAYIASFVPILVQPQILFVGAVVAVFYFLFSLRQLFSLVGVNAAACYAAIFFVILQPNNGEIFLNLTNAQWWIALGLFIQFGSIFFLGKKLHWIQYPILFIFLLSGPFSIALIGALICCALLGVRPQISRSVSSMVVLAFAIQSFLIISSQRGPTGEISGNLFDWFIAFRRFLFFGADLGFIFAITLIFWAVTFFVIFFQKNSAIRAASIYFLATAFVLICLSLISEKSAPLKIAPLGIGNRYSFIPYSLIVIAAYISISGLFSFVFIILLTTIIVNINFSHIRKESWQFTAFAKLSKYEKVFIPIQPTWNLYPGWYVDSEFSAREAKDIPLKISVLKKMNQCDILIDGCGAEQSASTFFLKNEGYCRDYKYIGLVIDANLESDGIVTSRWKNPVDKWSASGVIGRWAQKGPQKIMLAFKKESPHFDLSLNFAKSQTGVLLNGVDLYCLD